MANEETGPAEVQRLDAEMARLIAKIEQLKADLLQAEEELEQRREEDMAARRAVIIRETAGDRSTER